MSTQQTSMFRPNLRKTQRRSAVTLLEVIFHAAVRSIRKTHRNATFGLFLNMFQAVLFVLVFYFTFNFLGLRRTAVRGDFMLYTMSGILLFMAHTKTMGAVAGAETSTSQMMKHAPMNTAVSISAAALSTLYIQVLSAGVMLLFYHVVFKPITIDNPIGMIAMFLLAWASGGAIGMILLAAKPWNPDAVNMLVMVYQRANVVFSGKMFLANAMPGYLLYMFKWNPLFHIIDQTRGFVFLNYAPHNTNLIYPIKVALVCILIGLMGEFYTRRHASVSWRARG